MQNHMLKKRSACVHIDNTSKFEICKFSENKNWGVYLKNLGSTGKPILINTSFNLNKQPNVNTIEDAISTFIQWNDHLIHKITF